MTLKSLIKVGNNSEGIRNRLFRTEKSQNKLKLKYLAIRFKQLLNQKLLSFGIPILVLALLIFGAIYSSSFVNKINRANITDIYSFEIIFFSLFNLILVGFSVWKLFHSDMVDGQTKLELRSGFTVFFMYFYRLALLFMVLAIINFCEFSINSIFFAISKNKNETFAYRLFISPFLWLSFISLLGIMMTLFFVVVIKSKVSLVFSIIVAIFFLLSAPIAMHWNEIQVSPSLLESQKTTKIKKEKQSSINVEDVGLIQDFFTIEKYINLGENFSSFQNLFRSIERYDKYKFLEDGAIEKLKKNPCFAKEYFFYQKLLEIGKETNNMENIGEAISLLKQSGDSLLVSYASFLENQNLLSKIIKFDNHLNDEISFFYQFCNHIEAAKNYFKDGFSFEEGSDTPYYLNSVEQFNKKLRRQAKTNIFSQLNTLFFGQHKDYRLDNLMNLNRPLFTQGLNIRYEISFEKILKFSNFEGSNTPLFLIHTIKVKPNSNPIIVFVSYGGVLIFICGVICFAYKPKK